MSVDPIVPCGRDFVSIVEIELNQNMGQNIVVRNVSITATRLLEKTTQTTMAGKKPVNARSAGLNSLIIHRRKRATSVVSV